MQYWINDRFTLILGKIKKNDISSYENSAIRQCIIELDCIAIEDFINLFDKSKKGYKELEKIPNLPHYLATYSQKSKLNIDIIFQLNSISKNFKNLVKLNYFLNKKEELFKELELSKIYEKQSTISAITELIDNLEENLKYNQKKLTYFEEDYLKRKNQIDSVKEDISGYRNQITKLNEEKKSYFSKINKITRNMEKIIEEVPAKKDLVENSETTPNSEKIKKLQADARETQFQINQLQAKIEEKKTEITKLEPQFKVFDKDHNNIISIIQNDKARIKELKEKIKNEIQENTSSFDVDTHEIEQMNVRTKKEVELEISQIEQELAQIEIPKDYYNPKNPQNFSKIHGKILDLTNKVKSKQKQMLISVNEKEISEAIQQFERIENLIYELEALINIFLQKINLKTRFLLTINNTKEKLFIEIIFTRNEKEQLKFENLTTPEKVFFVIILTISIEMLNKSKYIIFSNLFIPNNYNKRGSIERTIKKIIPLFTTEPHLLDIKLIFIIANLDIKSNIKNLKLIKFEES